MEGRTQVLRLVLFTLAVSVSWTSSSYSLSHRECKAVVRTIGVAMKTKKISSPTPVMKGTWVSPRCEGRRTQYPDSNGEKTSFLLRMFEIQNRRRWTGFYFFYRDKDCTEPMYSLRMEGTVNSKSHNITFSFSAMKVATYRQDVDKTFHKVYNRSCPGHAKTTQPMTNPTVYDVDKSVSGRSRCLNALGIDREEFSSAFIQSHILKRSKVEGLLLKSVNLERSIDKSSSSSRPPVTYQWAMRRHDFAACLTCTKVGMSNLRNPPKLLARNSSNVVGAWGSAYCRQEDDSIYTSRFDKFVGNTFESTVFASFNSLCQDPSFKLRTSGILEKVGPSIEVPGGVVYKMTVTKAYLECYTDNFARILNVGSCGKEAWVAGKTQDLMPTNGCDVVGNQLGAPELVLIRAVRDEKRNELYLGIDPYGRRHKSGPVDYNYVSQDCASFPVAMAAPIPRVDVTTAPLTWPTLRSTTPPIKKEAVFIIRNTGTITPSGGTPSSGATPKYLLCFVVFVLAAMKII